MKPVRRAKAMVLLGSIACLSIAATESSAASNYLSWKAEGDAIKAPLGDLKGDPRRGRELVKARKKGNCLACHRMPIPEEDFHGTIAPPLTGVGARYKAGQLRLRVVDIKQINPMSLMPSFYKDPDTLHRVAKPFRGKTVLTAQEVEDVVAYLGTLK